MVTLTSKGFAYVPWNIFRTWMSKDGCFTMTESIIQNVLYTVPFLLVLFQYLNSLSDIIDSDNKQIEEPKLIKHSPCLKGENIIGILERMKDIFKCMSIHLQSINAKFDQL